VFSLFTKSKHKQLGTRGKNEACAFCLLHSQFFLLLQRQNVGFAKEELRMKQAEGW